MRRVAVSLLAATCLIIFVESAQSDVYLNRRLLQCDPLIYVIEPIEYEGVGLSLNRDYQNDFGACIGDPPGPPFIIEMPIVIDNVYDDDGTVLKWGSFTIDNSYGSGEPFELRINEGNYITVNGPFTVAGRSGDKVIFKGDTRVGSAYRGGSASIPLQEYTFSFSQCEFQASIYSAYSPPLEMEGGHLILDNCLFHSTHDVRALNYDGYRDGWNVEMTNSVFSFLSHPTSSPVAITDVSTIDLHNINFQNCQYPLGGGNNALMWVGVDTLLGLSGFTGSGNTANLIRVEGNPVSIRGSTSIQTTNDFPVFFGGASWINVDSNDTLSLEKGSVLQVGDNLTSRFINNYGTVILDSMVMTSYRDNSYGVYFPGVSVDEPNDANLWGGIDVQPGGQLELKNGTRLRWASGAIESEGEVKVDHSTIEQCWGAGIEVSATGSTRLEVLSSTIRQIYGLAEGIDYSISSASADSGSGRLIIDSSQIIQCGGYGVFVSGGIGKPLEDSLNVKISSSLIAGNGGSGVYGYFGLPADSIIVTNTRLIANGGSGLLLTDGGCDSMSVRLENNLSLANGDDGLKVATGFVDVIGNTSVLNAGMGLVYPQKPQKLGTVANNIFAYNDKYGFYCHAKYGGIVPGIAHNIFWQNDSENELYINSDGFLIYTVPELQALGGVGTTNDEFAPAFKPDYKAVVSFRWYVESQNMSWIWVDGDSLEAGRLKGLAIMPSHRDTTAWFYVLDNSTDTIYVAGDITSVTDMYDTLTVAEYHLAPFSPAVEFGDNEYVTTEFDIDGDGRILDADENETELVDAGADEYNPGATNLRILVYTPTQDTTLVPGSNIPITWFAPVVTLVNIDYTIEIPLGEEPTTWLEVAHNLPASVPVYNWEVPNLMSSRCMIRVSDVSSPDFSGTSELFHIKQPRLTRFAEDSTYDFFLPSTHGWSFANSTSALWPQTWWQQYDYVAGVDPYTGNEYPSFDTAYPFGAIAPSIFPSWPIFVKTLSQDQCYNQTPTGWMYLMRAVNRWADIGHVFGGSCAGMSSSALLAFGSRAELDADWGYLDLPNNVYQEAMTDNLREFVSVLQIYVYGKEQGSWLAGHSGTSVDSTVGSIRNMLLASSRENDAFLYIANQTATSAHAVFPWAVIDDPNTNRVQINVYDPNMPGIDNLYIEADTVANVWSYSAEPTWGGSKHMFLDYPVRWCLAAPELKILAKKHPSLAVGADSATMVELLYPSDGYLAVYNGVGDSVGIGAAGGFNAIEGAVPLLPMFGPGNTPYGILLPDQAYRVTLSGLVDSSVRLGFYYDSLYVGYSRVDADSTQTDRVTINGNLIVSNPDAASKTTQLRMVQTLPEKERSLAVGGLTIDQNDSVSLSPIDSAGWYLTYRSEVGQYSLWLREVSNTGEKKFFSSEVPIDVFQSHILTPDWTTLNGDSCTIYIDNNHDMVIDDSMVVYGDFLVGVEDDPDETLPYRFAVSQNYPNPFNPATTIDYSLPRRSRVTIEVYNVLGQRVRSLVDREESAGSYMITWDGTNTAGSPVATGIYLYRFQAGDHVETKKMLLLK